MSKKDMHLSFIFAALVEVPAFSIPFIINYNGRRWTLFIAFLAAGAASLFYAFVPPGTYALQFHLIHSRSSCIIFAILSILFKNHSVLSKKCDFFRACIREKIPYLVQLGLLKFLDQKCLDIWRCVIFLEIPC